MEDFPQQISFSAYACVEKVICLDTVYYCMKTVDRYVRKNGVESLLREIERIVKDESEPHELPKRSKVDAEEWIDFLLEFDDATTNGFGYKDSTLTIPQFNYVKVEKEFGKYVQDNSPAFYEDAILHVTDTVESVDSREQVNTWLEFSDIELDDDHRVMSVDLNSVDI